jgi:hypothetical protein
MQLSSKALMACPDKPAFRDSMPIVVSIPASSHRHWGFVGSMWAKRRRMASLFWQIAKI